MADNAKQSGENPEGANPEPKKRWLLRALDFSTGQSRIPDPGSEADIPPDKFMYFPGQEEANVPDVQLNTPDEHSNK